MNPVHRKLALRITTIAAVLLIAAVCSGAAPAGRYTVSATTVYDNKTGLTWQRTVPSQSYYSVASAGPTASSYCESLGAGWRVPTVKELVTIVDYSVPAPGPTIDSTAFPNTPTSQLYIAATLLSPTSSWNVSFTDGEVCDNCGGEGPYLVRCVQ